MIPGEMIPDDLSPDDVRWSQMIPDEIFDDPRDDPRWYHKIRGDMISHDPSPRWPQMIPNDHRYRYRYRYRYRPYADTYTDTHTETNTDTDMLRRISNRQPVCKLRYARARGNQSATSNAYKELLGCFAGIFYFRVAFSDDFWVCYWVVGVAKTSIWQGRYCKNQLSQKLDFL